jgi:FkbH-like protein
VKVTEALKILQAARVSAAGPPYRIWLVCGFTPLHLETFLAAHLQQKLPDRTVVLQAGLYGNTLGTLEASGEPDRAEAVAIALEWQDLDPRLGFRSAGAWGPSALTDILAVARASLARMAAAIDRIPAAVACALPTLPLPPVFHTPGTQAAQAELALERELLDFAERCSRRPGFSLVNRNRLAEESPAAGRFDFKSDLLTGLPYTTTHADLLAAALARLLAPPAPKKGLITDLDDTLWHGLVGEIGPENVGWDLAGHHQLHGLYQKLLAALAEEGVLVGIASKNDPAIARQALERPDILLPRERVYPVEVHWQPKSGSVGRILRAWNIGADSVVFVDDSPMELAEVAAAHPGMECLPFPAGDAAAGYTLLRRLRDLFGKPRLAEEDSIRLESLRRGAAFQEAVQEGASAEEFLRQAEATVTLDFDLESADPRTLELVNKTNQFNLNGIRYTEAEWRARLAQPGAVLMTVSYRDKFGPLGKIAVLGGRQQDDMLHIDAWVMSCRAFARRIEHQCLQALFERSGAGKMIFHFAATPKNGPLREFFTAVHGSPPQGHLTLTRQRFTEVCPPLYHRIEEPFAGCRGASGAPACSIEPATRSRPAAEETESSKQPWTQSQPA